MKQFQVILELDEKSFKINFIMTHAKSENEHSPFQTRTERENEHSPLTNESASKNSTRTPLRKK